MNKQLQKATQTLSAMGLVSKTFELVISDRKAEDKLLTSLAVGKNSTY